MIVLTSIVSYLLYFLAGKEFDMLDRNIIPLLRYLLPGLIIADAITVFKDSIMNKGRTLIW